MRRRASEVDVGILGTAERAMLPFDRYRERELDWLSFALGLAHGARMRMRRLEPGTPNYFAEDAKLRAAQTSAMQHFNNLKGRGYVLPVDLVASMEREGI